MRQNKKWEIWWTLITWTETKQKKNCEEKSMLKDTSVDFIVKIRQIDNFSFYYIGFEID